MPLTQQGLTNVQVEPNATRKRSGRTVIGHISDLHFRSGTDTKTRVWQALREDLKRNEIDLLAVTGDVIENSIRDNLGCEAVKGAFEAAYAYLTATLCPALKIDPQIGLLVVPGNHDYRLKGLIDNKTWRYLRQQVWSAPASFDLFHAAFEKQFRSKFLPGMSLCIFTFDSNTANLTINFATGRVDERELIRFADEVTALSNTYKAEWQSATRIALVHHHPMPIAATELGTRITDNEALLVLLNSGIFMSEMINKNVDLILHGHKHCPAFSKATFPVEGDSEHSVVVVGAGSAGAGVSEGQCYNLITVYDDGNISLQRRTLKNATYRGSNPIDLRTHEDYRNTKFERLSAKTESEFRIKKCTRLERISEGSGDVRARIEFDGITSHPKGESRQKLPVIFTSKSGFFRNPVISNAKGAQVTWEWENPATKSPKQGFIAFDPPVGGDAVSFTLDRLTHNAIHFNERDRQDASRERADESVSVHQNVGRGASRDRAEESISVCTKNLYELYVLKILFPSKHFPKQFKLQTLDERNTRDYREEKLALSRFVAFDDDATVVLMLERPLPGYTYKVIWSLPTDDIDEMGLSPHAARLMRATNSRLLALPSEGDESRQCAVRKVLDELRVQIGSGTIGAYSIADSALEVSLHVYSERDGGLIMVSSTKGTCEDKVVMVGRSTVGQAYRRRALVCWAFDPKSDNSDYWDYSTGHSGIVSLPLFYPLDSGGRTCVVTIASSSETSGFLRVIDDIEVRRTRNVLTQHIHAWYAKSLASALGLPDLSKGDRVHASEEE